MVWKLGEVLLGESHLGFLFGLVQNKYWLGFLTFQSLTFLSFPLVDDFATGIVFLFSILGAKKCTKQLTKHP